MTAAQALKLYRDSLTEYEQSEILEYPQASTLTPTPTPQNPL